VAAETGRPDLASAVLTAEAMLAALDVATGQERAA
jgi:hypothetical protein